MKRVFLFPLIVAALLTGGCQRQPLPPVEDKPAPHLHVAVPPVGAYTGAYIDFGETEDDVSLEKIEDFEASIGKHQAIVASSSFWGKGTFPLHNLQIITRHGSVPLIYWSPWDHPFQQELPPDRFSLTNILAGKSDAYIDSWADQAKAFHEPMFVAWGLEMNGSWFPWSGAYYGADKEIFPGVYAGPELFKKAYRYVVDRVRARGAKNIIWVFQANNRDSPDKPWNAMKQYYPGDDYVDWLGMSAYGVQFHEDDWCSAADALVKPYQDLCALSPTKPIMLAEWGVGEFPALGSKPQWIADAFHLMETQLTRIKAAVYWNERWQNDDESFSNLHTTSSPQSMRAFREGVDRPYWLGYPDYN